MAKSVSEASKFLSSKFLRECLENDGLSPGGREYTLESLREEYAKRGESEAERLWREFLRRESERVSLSHKD